jgi:hypothetical protein
MRANKNNAGATPPMRLLDSDDADPLPTDGMEVEEFRDADTVRLFMLEWRRRVLRDVHDQPGAMPRALRS